MLNQILFLLILIGATVFFTFNVRKIIKNINKGKPELISGNRAERFKLMTKVAIGQSKMVKKPIAGLMHIFVYVGFIIINIEVLEIILDGLLHKHRILSNLSVSIYGYFIGVFEVLALLVILGCLIFLIRRNILRIKRFHLKEMTLWPRTDANIILITEVFLMTAFLFMDASDYVLQSKNNVHYIQAGLFPISGYLVPLISNLPESSLIFIERFCWWFHIVGILAFLNYLPYSKHFHILLAFPNVFYSKLGAKARISNMESVTNEVKLMLDPNADAYSNNQPEAEIETKFGANDYMHFSWKSIMDAYTCTECGRCSAGCPANLTGKKLSPRKIVMDLRDRVETSSKKSEVTLLNNYITKEEIWACTTCNFCTTACPVNIDQVSVILELRRHLVLEESAAPSPLNSMFTNIENNGAPWQYPPSERISWSKDIYMNKL